METAYLAEQLFDGWEWRQQQVIVVKDGLIIEVVPVAESKHDAVALKGTAYPSFVDVQVYGAGGKLLAAFPSADTLALMHQTFSAQGTYLFQPTVATNSPEVFRECIDAVREYWNNGGKGVHGLHLEGPWINPEKKGAHIEQFVHAPSNEEVHQLLEYGKGVITMITLAPEIVSGEVIALINDAGIIISAGHSNATYQQSVDSFEKGISTVTHLYNDMSGLHHRSPGMTGAVFNDPCVTASIIPDGIHVAYEAVSLAKKTMGKRLFAITDAVTETTEGAYRHQLANGYYECNGTLSGSALTMHQAFVNLVLHCGMDQGEAHRMCSLYPARVLGQEEQYGRIQPGFTASLVVLDKELNLVQAIP
jgi:N-acetylglucosamine-6-phosphate deacetylase